MPLNRLWAQAHVITIMDFRDTGDPFIWQMRKPRSWDTLTVTLNQRPQHTTTAPARHTKPRGRDSPAWEVGMESELLKDAEGALSAAS